MTLFRSTNIAIQSCIDCYNIVVCKLSIHCIRTDKIHEFNLLVFCYDNPSATTTGPSATTTGPGATTNPGASAATIYNADNVPEPYLGNKKATKQELQVFKPRLNQLQILQCKGGSQCCS